MAVRDHAFVDRLLVLPQDDLHERLVSPNIRQRLSEMVKTWRDERPFRRKLIEKAERLLSIDISNRQKPWVGKTVEVLFTRKNISGTMRSKVKCVVKAAKYDPRAGTLLKVRPIHGTGSIWIDPPEK